MKYKDSSFVRIRMNESELRGILEVLDKTKPTQISNFNGERQGIATFRVKLTTAYKKLK